MTIAFIRHGETDWNAARRLQGSTDIPLNDVGRQQARDAAEVLAGSSWEVIVSSPLSRARETASIIADGIGLELGRSYDNLVERHFGEAEGLTGDGIRARWGDTRDYPGMESLDSVVARGTAALQQIADEYAGRNTVVVAHGAIIRYTLATLADRKLDPIRNGSISTLDRADDVWTVRTVNGVELVVNV